MSKYGFSFSLSRLLGIAQAKQKFARTTGVPTTKGGMQRKIGASILKLFFKQKLIVEQPKRKNDSCLFSLIMMGIIVFIIIVSGGKLESGSSNTYVKPHVTRTGKFVKGHVRKSVSSSPNAVKKQYYSKGYYQRHKSRYTKSKKE